MLEKEAVTNGCSTAFGYEGGKGWVCKGPATHGVLLLSDGRSPPDRSVQKIIKTSYAGVVPSLIELTPDWLTTHRSPAQPLCGQALNDCRYISGGG